jgi:hypothetical protein
MTCVHQKVFSSDEIEARTVKVLNVLINVKCSKY